MDKKRKEKDMERDDKNKPSRDEKKDRYEIERGNEPHREDDFPDEEEDQTR
jgi:hypothetical protein